MTDRDPEARVLAGTKLGSHVFMELEEPAHASQPSMPLLLVCPAVALGHPVSDLPGNEAAP